MIRLSPRAATLSLLALLTALAPRVLSQTQPPFLSQEEAVRLALASSPTLDVARRERNVGLITADRNRPAFRPDVQASLSQTLRTPRVDLPGRPDDVILPNSLTRLEVGVRQPLYQFGVGSAAGQRSQAMAAAARSEFRRAELDTVLEAREAYLNVQRAERMVAVAELGVTVARENLRITEAARTAGFQADVDVLEAQRNLAEAENGVRRARHGVTLSLANLNRVAGRPLDTAVRVEPPPAPPADPAPTAELLLQAREQRPELEALRQRLREAEAGIRLARASGQPRISVEAAYALQTETVLTPRSGFAAGVVITAPLFNKPVTRHTVREAEERLAQLRSALLAQEQGIALELERYRLDMAEARDRMRLATATLALAEKELEITRLRLERGHAIQLELQGKRLAVERSHADRATAESDLALAHARLLRALGSGPSAPAEEEAPPKPPPTEK